MQEPNIFPTFKIADEWERKIEDVIIVYRVRCALGDASATGHLASCWQRGVPSFSFNGRFSARPERTQVEARFADAAREIVERASKKPSKKAAPALHALAQQPPLEDKNFLPPEDENSLRSKKRKNRRHTPEVQRLLSESERLRKHSKQLTKHAADLSRRLLCLNERSLKHCKW